MAKDLYNNALPVRVVQPQTIQGANLVSGDIDLAGFEAVDVVVEFGDIAEMGTSPEGAARIDLRLEHAEDDGAGMPGAYDDVTDNDVLGSSGISGGIVASTTSDLAPLHRGYRGAGASFA